MVYTLKDKIQDNSFYTNIFEHKVHHQVEPGNTKWWFYTVHEVHTTALFKITNLYCQVELDDELYVPRRLYINFYRTLWHLHSTANC